MRAPLLALALLLLAAVPAEAQEIEQTLQIPTKHREVSVEVGGRRPAGGAKVPIILTYSPYNILAVGRETDDTYGNRYVPKGVTFKPQDWTLRKGHRLMVILAGSNTAER